MIIIWRCTVYSLPQFDTTAHSDDEHPSYHTKEPCTVGHLKCTVISSVYGQWGGARVNPLKLPLPIGLIMTNRIVVATKRKFFSWILYTKMLCELVTNVVYDNFQDILVPVGAKQCSRDKNKFLKSISVHFNCSFMQPKQQNSAHNNIPLLGVIYENHRFPNKSGCSYASLFIAAVV